MYRFLRYRFELEMIFKGDKKSVIFYTKVEFLYGWLLKQVGLYKKLLLSEHCITKRLY